SSRYPARSAAGLSSSRPRDHAGGDVGMRLPGGHSPDAVHVGLVRPADPRAVRAARSLAHRAARPRGFLSGGGALRGAPGRHGGRAGPGAGDAARGPVPLPFPRDPAGAAPGLSRLHRRDACRAPRLAARGNGTLMLDVALHAALLLIAPPLLL